MSVQIRFLRDYKDDLCPTWYRAGRVAVCNEEWAKKQVLAKNAELVPPEGPSSEVKPKGRKRSKKAVEDDY